MRFSLLGCLLCFVSWSTTFALPMGQKAIVSGNAPEYAGRELLFFMRTDYITQQNETLAKTIVEPNGNFSLEIPLFETQLVLLDIGVFSCYMYMEPGNTYQISLPPLREKTESERLNPYFTPILLQFRDLNAPTTSSTNEEIAHFDAFQDSLTQIYFPRIAAHDSLYTATELNNQLENYSIPQQFRFANQYKTYRIGLMRYMTSTQRVQALSKKYFQNQTVLHRNPAYMDLFNLVYDQYLLYHGRTEDGKEIYQAVSKNKDYQQLQKILIQNDHLTADSLRELVILKGLYDEFYSANFSRSALLAILEALNDQTQIAEHTNIAQQIRERITKLLPGFIPHSFTLQDANSKRVSLKEFRGKMVLLCFCTTTSYSCLQDFELLARFQKRYGEHLQILCVCADQDINTMRRFVQATHYPWTFLHYGDAPHLLLDYDIRSYPTYFLLDTDGRILLSPAPGPQEQLERIIISHFKANKWTPKASPDAINQAPYKKSNRANLPPTESGQ